MSLFQRSKVKPQTAPNCAGYILYDEKTFYNRFYQDLLEAQEEGPLTTLKSVLERFFKRRFDTHNIKTDQNLNDSSYGFSRFIKLIC